MIMRPEFLRELDPRRSYLPPPPAGAEASRITEHVPISRISSAMSDASLQSLSTEDLRRELERREGHVAQVIARREKVAADLAALDRELASLGMLAGKAPNHDGVPHERKPARMITPLPKNSVPLADAIAMAVEPRAIVTPAEAADLVRRNGYVSTSKTFAQAVSLALAKHPGFKRVERGRYERLGVAAD